jgi:hypothetical protein
MTDMIYIGITVLFFAATWGLMKMCDDLDTHKSGGTQ